MAFLSFHKRRYYEQEKYQATATHRSNFKRKPVNQNIWTSDVHIFAKWKVLLLTPLPHREAKLQFQNQDFWQLQAFAFVSALQASFFPLLL